MVDLPHRESASTRASHDSCSAQDSNKRDVKYYRKTAILYSVLSVLSAVCLSGQCLLGVLPAVCGETMKLQV